MPFCVRKEEIALNCLSVSTSFYSTATSDQTGIPSPILGKGHSYNARELLQKFEIGEVEESQRQGRYTLEEQ